MEKILLDYRIALFALVVLCCAVLVQSVMTGLFAFTKRGGQTPGKIIGDPQDFSYRVIRTHANSIENLPAFAVIVILAALVGVDTQWVNGLACAHVGLRLLFWPIYYSPIGAITPGLRSPIYALALIVNFILGILTLMALMS